MKTDERKNKTATDDVWIPTCCDMCFNVCGMKAHRLGGVVVQVAGDPDSPQGHGRLCSKAHASIMSLFSPYRVKTPLKRTNPEKGIGVDPKWVEISWEEALDTIVQKLKKIRQDDPRKLIILTFDLSYYMSGMRLAMGNAFGTPNIWTGGAKYFCGNGVHPIAHLRHGVFSMDPDLGYCDYLISIGTQSGFAADANMVSRATKMADARIRGMKLVVVDPIGTVPAAAKADDWIPIRPGTDAAFALAIVNVLVNELGIYDAEFIKKYTNGPYLIGQDGHYLRDKATNKALIWDAEEGRAKTYDSPDITDFALEGSYQVNGTRGTPAFQVVKDHIRKYTCEEVSKITTIPADTIRRIATEFGRAARIGSKIVIKGKELPYRPACVHYLRGAQSHKHAVLSGLAIHLVNMIVGSIDVPGGILGSNPVLLPGSVGGFRWGPLEGSDGMLSSG